jgi:hypothetical protein
MNDRDIEDTRQPDDGVESETCPYCGQDMTYHCMPDSSRTKESWFECDNQFCPSKFDKLKYGSVVINMAEHLVEVEQELRETKTKLKYSVRREEFYKNGLDKALTQSQNKGE